MLKKSLIILLFAAANATLWAQQLEPLDIFELEHVSDPQISPDGNQVVYVRNFMDIMTDRKRSNLWIMNFDGSNNRPLTTGGQNDYAPRFSPDGKQLAYISNKDGKSQIYLRWLDNSAEAQLTHLQSSPSNLNWSPDGNWLGFSMFVKEAPKGFASIPAPPPGAKWAEPARYIDKMKYRGDGAGYLRDGYRQLFILSIDGGTPRQITKESFDHGGNFAWTKDGESLIFSANRNEDRELNPNNSEIYEVSISSGDVYTLTSRKGPDNAPQMTMDGKSIVYTGLDDKYLGYQQAELYIMNRDGSDPRRILSDFKYAINSFKVSKNSDGVFFSFDKEGNTKLAFTNWEGKVTELAGDLGGLSLGRPYGGSQFNIGPNGKYAFTHSTPDHPADLALGKKGGSSKVVTRLNEDLFGYIKLGEVEEIWYESSYDQQKIQGWICKPPNFDPSKKYPLLLEIHGGPFANYGDRFSAEVQLFAAAGYVVLYTNPRGSSSYGKDFGNLIHHNYPNQDYDDLMTGVDEVIKKGYIDEDQLYVTGGSGGGVLTAWIVGHTDRFRAAVVAKPVINWYSFVLNADAPGFFYKYWFPGLPWDNLEHYMKRSPISYAKNVTTPTMLLTGEKDYRTPISETEQYYTALKLVGVETAMVRIPEAGHGIAARPSYLISKVLHILEWFDRHKE